MSNEDNGNLCAGVGSGANPGGNLGSGSLLKPTSSSTEDLSEYTDADESISAPTEFLAEFLSAVMLKDYETALKYCKLILQYEPNNITAKEFYPLILEKLENTYNQQSATTDGNSSDESSAEDDSSSADNDVSSNSDSDSSVEEEEQEGEEEEDDGSGDGEPGDKPCSSDGDATTASYSSLEDEEAETDQLSNLAAKYKVDNMDLGNGNKILCDASNGKWNTKGGSNASTTSSASGILPFGTSSDSESPTEPISQQTIAMLRAKVVPPRH